MSKLIFELKGDERKWDIVLNEFLGEKLKEEAVIELDATVKDHFARVHFLNYKSNPDLIKKISDSDKILSAYIIDNKKITKHIKQ